MLRSARFLLSRAICNSTISRSPKPLQYSIMLKPSASESTLISPPKFSNLAGAGRQLSTGGEAADYDKEVDEINLKFAEAREEIEAAMESKDTVYFDEEAECAREAVSAAVGMFDALLARLQETERAALQRSMGLKMEQLKAELKQLDD